MLPLLALIVATQPPGEAVGGFTLPEDRDAKQRLAAVTDYLAKKEVPWEVVCATAQQLLDGKSDSFTVRPDGGRASVKARVSELLGALPPDGKQFYELTYGPPATELLKQATAKGYDRAKLADVAQRFFHTKAGTQAAVLLASLQLDAGDTAEAAYGFRRLLARPDADQWAGPWLLARAAAAYKRSGDARLSGEADQLFDRLERVAPRDGLPVGRKLIAADDFRRQAAEVAARVAVAEPVAGRYGNASHTGRGPAGSPFLDPAFELLLLYYPDRNRYGFDWVREKLAFAYGKLDPGRKDVALPGFFPVTVAGLVVYRGYDGVYAVATRDGYVYQGKAYKAGQIVWWSEMYYGVQTLAGSATRPDAARITEQAWDLYWRQTGRVLIENTQTGSLSHDGKRVYCVDDWTVPPGPQPANLMGGFNPNPVAAQVKGSADTNLLYAIDLDTGNVAWSLGGPTDEPPSAADKPLDAQRLTSNGLFLGPPVAADGKLYVLVEKDGQVKLGCLDPGRLVDGVSPTKQPVLLWAQDLGGPSTKLANDPQRRTHACYAAFADGVLVCPTHAGAAVAVDVNARTLLWAKGYTAPPDPGRQVGEGGPVGFPGGRPVPVPRVPVGPDQLAPSSADRWRAAAPIVADGKVVLAAFDAEQLLCLDLRTGEQLWADPRRKDDLYVGGVVNGVVLVVGKAGVRGLKLAEAVGGKPAEAWPAVASGCPSGHGTVGTDGVFYLPLADGGGGPADTPDPQVWAIDAATGTVRAKTTFRRPDPSADARRVLGNLLFHEGLLIAQSVDSLTAFPLLGRKQDEMTSRLKADPTDPRGLLLRGELALDKGDYKVAAADFRSAADRDPPADLRAGLRQKLYVVYTELLRTDFAAAEGYLGEYAKLCEVPPDAETPEARGKAADETTRRRALYLTLLSRGREKQGRLAEAVAACREFAGLGDGKPMSVAGEAVKVRPDVWAEGRLADLLAAAPPAVRAEVASKADAEWREVKQSGDLTRLRKFVAGHVAHDPAGKAAALELAGRLLAQTAPADRREAVGLLLRLAADADPATRAAGVERLAAALTAAGQIDHAVGLFAQLGTEGDGKLATLLADRRMLAHLEPGRPPLAGRYAVTDTKTGPAIAGATPTPVRLDGPLLPSLRGVRLAFHPSGNNDNRCTLVASDGRTGDKILEVGDLPPPQGAEPVALAAGHLLMLVHGVQAIFLDLLGKESWRYALLGPTAGVGSMNVSQVEGGDTEYTFDDGFKLRLGRAAVLRPGYAALVTRGGLVCLDPCTQQTRWERADVSGRVQVWGDDRHLFLVETAADGSASSRVLRASDGAAVNGVPDFAKLFAGSGRRAVVGRNLLLDGGSPRALRLYDPLVGKDVWMRELPADATLLDSADRGLTGFVTAAGKLAVLDAATGKPLAETALPPPGELAKATLLADADRLYLFLTPQQAEAAAMPVNPFAVGQPAIAQLAVNGPAYCLDRRTGGRLWQSDRLFVGRQLVTERFAELPALVTCTDSPRERPGEATPTPLVRVEVVDKASGRVRFHGGYPTVGGFQAAVADPKTHAVELVRPDVRVRLAPDAGR